MEWDQTRLRTTIEGLRTSARQMEARGIDTKSADFVAAKNFGQYLENVLEAAEEGRPIVYHQFSLFPELIYSFDLQPLAAEFIAGYPMSLEATANVKHIDTAVAKGIPRELCTANTTAIADMLLKTVPPPKFMLAHSQPCDAARIAHQVVQGLTGAPLFYLDSPYGDGEDDVAYVERQLKEMVSFIEGQIGRRLDWDRAREVIEESNKLIEYWAECNELRKLVPCPTDNTGALMGAGITLMGHPLGTAIVKAVRDDAKERADRGEGVVPGEEIRASWFYLHVSRDRPYVDYLRETYGHVSVIELLSYWVASTPIDTSSPERIIRGLAKRYQTSIPMGRQMHSYADIYIDDLLYTAKEWKADCIIMAGAIGCKGLKATYAMAKKECHKAGIPIMMFDFDVLDPRVVPKEEYRRKIEDFLTTVVLPAKQGV